MKFTFFLMNKKGLDVLASFIEEYGEALIDKVIISPDANVQKDYYNEIKALLIAKNIDFFKRTDAFEICTEYSFSVGWRWLIKSEAKIIVFHDSLLPRYRGFAPLVSMLINREKKIGVTALFASESYDEGDILIQKCIEIKYPITIETAISLISPLYFVCLKNIVDSIYKNEALRREPQVNINATYSLWRNESDYIIDWTQDSEYLKRFIDSVSFPYKGAKSFIDSKEITVLDSEIVTDVVIENRSPGKIIFKSHGFPVVVCGKGLLKLTKITDEKGRDLLPLSQFRIKFGV